MRKEAAACASGGPGLGRQSDKRCHRWPDGLDAGLCAAFLYFQDIVTMPSSSCVESFVTMPSDLETSTARLGGSAQLCRAWSKVRKGLQRGVRSHEGQGPSWDSHPGRLASSPPCPAFLLGKAKPSCSSKQGRGELQPHRLTLNPLVESGKMPNRFGKGWGKEAEKGRGVKLKMFSAASLGERKEALFSFSLTKATQEENSSLGHSALWQVGRHPDFSS